jgi:hypothetical protein
MKRLMLSMSSGQTFRTSTMYVVLNSYIRNLRIICIDGLQKYFSESTILLVVIQRPCHLLKLSFFFVNWTEYIHERASTCLHVQMISRNVAVKSLPNVGL